MLLFTNIVYMHTRVCEVPVLLLCTNSAFTHTCAVPILLLFTNTIYTHIHTSVCDVPRIVHGMHLKVREQFLRISFLLQLQTWD